MSISVFAVLFLCIITIPHIKRNDSEAENLSRDDTLSLKGLSCVTILFHHFSGWVTNVNPVIYVMSHWGSFVVAIFFFLSAYGITKSSYKSREISGRFLIKRLVKILIPYWLCDLICVLIFSFTGVSGSETVSAKSIILSVFTLNDTVPFSWYAASILFLYLVFFVCAKILPDIDLSLKTAVVCIIAMPFVPDLWAASYLAFPIGICFSLHEKEIRQFIKKKFTLTVSASSVIMLAAIGLKFFGQAHNSQMLMNISDAAGSAMFVLLVYSLLMKIKIGNRLLSFYGKISYEFYLLHGVSVFVTGHFLFPEHQFLFFVSSIALTTLAAFIINKLTGLVIPPIIKKIRN